MIAAVCSWHEHHESAANEIERRLTRRQKILRRDSGNRLAPTRNVKSDETL